MSKFKVQRYTTSVVVPAEDVIEPAGIVDQLNGILRGITISAPDLTGTSFIVYITGQRGETLFTKSSLVENALNYIGIDGNNFPLAIPLSLFGVSPVKIKSSGTPAFTNILTLTSLTQNPADGETVTINGPTDSRVYRFKNTPAQINDIKIIPHVAASNTFVTNNTNPIAEETVTVDYQNYTFKTALTETKASGVVTSTVNGVPIENDTIVIGSVTYRFRDTLAQINDVKIGATGQATLNNLRAAINLTGTAGVEYFAGQVANPDVSAPSAAQLNVADYDLTIQALVIGVAGNSIVLTENATNITVSGSGTLENGADAIQNEILIGSDGDDTLTNLKKAINNEAGEGVKYSTGTPASEYVTASVVSHTFTATAIVAGASGNEIPFSEDATNITAGDNGGFLIGGEDKAYATLDNLRGAINADGAGNGSDYFAGTLAHGDVSASIDGGVLDQMVASGKSTVSKRDDVLFLSVTEATWDADYFTTGGETAARTFNIDLLIERE